MTALPTNIEDWGDAIRGNWGQVRKAWEQNLVEEGYAKDHPAFSEWNPERWTTKACDDKPLAGIPYGVKDLFDIPNTETCASSLFLSQVRKSGERQSRSVDDLKNLGAEWVCKTHLNEFAYGLSGENEHYGDCPHPQLVDRLSGGSSSGSAFAVGKGIVPFALGTDTGGSIRVPSSFCGLYGMRLIPEHSWSKDCFPLAPSFDTAGWFTRTAKDMNRLLGLINPMEKEGSLGRGLALVDRDLFLNEDCFKRTQAFVEQYELEHEDTWANDLKNGASTWVSAFNTLQSKEAYDLHREWLIKYGEQYDSQTKLRLERGGLWTEKQVEEANRTKVDLADWWKCIFNHYDYVILPATPCSAVKKSDLTSGFREKLLTLTAPASLGKLPVLTLPLNLNDSGESIGIQLVSSRLDSPVFQAFLKEEE